MARFVITYGSNMILTVKQPVRSACNGELIKITFR
jgi:hypothetical protein